MLTVSSSVFLQFFAANPHFLISDCEEEPVRELGPFLFKFIDGLIPATITWVRSHMAPLFRLLLHCREQHSVTCEDAEATIQLGFLVLSSRR